MLSITFLWELGIIINFLMLQRTSTYSYEYIVKIRDSGWPWPQQRARHSCHSRCELSHLAPTRAPTCAPSRLFKLCEWKRSSKSHRPQCRKFGPRNSSNLALTCSINSVCPPAAWIEDVQNMKVSTSQVSVAHIFLPIFFQHCIWM